MGWRTLLTCGQRLGLPVAIAVGNGQPSMIIASGALTNGCSISVPALKKTSPLFMGALAWVYINFHKTPQPTPWSATIHYLRAMPAHIQQLRPWKVTVKLTLFELVHGVENRPTGPIIWVSPGAAPPRPKRDAYQPVIASRHPLVPVDFIVPLASHKPNLAKHTPQFLVR